MITVKEVGIFLSNTFIILPTFFEKAHYGEEFKKYRFSKVNIQCPMDNTAVCAVLSVTSVKGE